ncbi:hypothetical protein AM1H77_11790 [Apilactobacillus micheneri]
MEFNFSNERYLCIIKKRYRTVCRFRISDDESENLISKCMSQLTKYLRKNNYIDDVSFIDGTKILGMLINIHLFGVKI